VDGSEGNACRQDETQLAGYCRAAKYSFRARTFMPR
jgi:hypothetical protein